MTDTNKNGKIDPDEAEGIVGEENIVNEEYRKDEIDAKKLEEITSLDVLGKEAEQIRMEADMGGSTGFEAIKPEEIIVEVPEEEKKSEEDSQPVATAIPVEAVQEVVKEQSSEIDKESSGEIPEIGKEFKPGI